MLVNENTKNSRNVYHRNILVQVESIVSGHRLNVIRERLAEKLELVRFDPWSKLMVTAIDDFYF